MNLKVNLPENDPIIEKELTGIIFRELDKERKRDDYIVQDIMNNFQIRLEDLPDRLEKKTYPYKDEYWVDGKKVHEESIDH